MATAVSKPKAWEIADAFLRGELAYVRDAIKSADDPAVMALDVLLCFSDPQAAGKLIRCLDSTR